jgi:hypothetical protein
MVILCSSDVYLLTISCVRYPHMRRSEKCASDLTDGGYGGSRRPFPANTFEMTFHSQTFRGIARASEMVRSTLPMQRQRGVHEMCIRCASADHIMCLRSACAPP